MNRRSFLGGLFAILPAATCYKRIWKELSTGIVIPADMIDGQHRLKVIKVIQNSLTIIWTVDGKESSRSVLAWPHPPMVYEACPDGPDPYALPHDNHVTLELPDEEFYSEVASLGKHKSYILS